MRLLSFVICAGLSSAAHAQSGHLLGELREFVKVDYDRTWKSEMTASDPNVVFVTAMPRSSTAATWEQAITFHFFRQRPEYTREPRRTLLEVAAGFLELMSGGCEKFLVKKPRATNVSDYSIVVLGFECRGERNPNPLRPRSLSYANIMMISGRYNSFMLVHRFESNRFAAVPAALKRQLDQAARTVFRSARICEPEPSAAFENRRCRPGTEVRLGTALP